MPVGRPAKLNLFLEVLGQRPDGYHEVAPVMVVGGSSDAAAALPGLNHP